MAEQCRRVLFMSPCLRWSPEFANWRKSTVISKTTAQSLISDSNCVKVILRFAVIAVLISSGVLPATARKKPAREPTPNKAHIEAATRLQIFLDRNNFSPGKLDGRHNEFTWKALALYRESRGEQLQIPPPQGKTKSDIAPDVT